MKFLMLLVITTVGIIVIAPKDNILLLKSDLSLLKFLSSYDIILLFIILYLLLNSVIGRKKWIG